MKKTLFAFLIAVSLSAVLHAQDGDTTRFGDSWLYFAPKPGQLTSFLRTIPYSYKVTPDSTVTMTELVSPLDTMVGHLGQNGIVGFPYRADSDMVVYGLAVTMNRNWLPECEGMEQRFRNTLQSLDNYYSLLVTGLPYCKCTDDYATKYGDMGYSAILMKQMPNSYKSDKCTFEMLDSVHTGLKKEDWGHRHIRQSTFIYEFDTLWPNDTVELFEFYFSQPYQMHANDTIWASQYYQGGQWFNDADFMFTPHYAITTHPMHKDFLITTNKDLDMEKPIEGITDSIVRKQFTSPIPWIIFYHVAPLAATTSFNKLQDSAAAYYPFIIPIVKLRCTSPKGWTAEHNGSEVALGWNQFSGCTGYEVLVNNVTTGDSTVITIDDPDATGYTLHNIDNSDYYRIRARKLCYYDNRGYDTIVHSDWTEVYTLGTPPDTTDTTGIALTSGMHFDVHPNPTSGHVTVTTPNADGGLLTLTDMAGRELQQVTLQPGRHEHSIDLHPLPAGTYLLKLVSPAGTGTLRLLVQ